MRTTASGFARVITGADDAASSIERAAIASGRSAAEAAALATAWVSTGNAMTRAATEADKVADNLSKTAQATKSQGDALVALAQLHGNETALLQAEAAAAQANASALEAVASKRREQLEIMQAELAAKQNLIAGNAEEQKASEVELKTLTEKIDKVQAEAQASTQAAEAAKNAATARQAAAAAANDHAGQLTQLTQKLNEEKAALAALRVDVDNGTTSAEQLAEAERRVALAANLVRDALADQMEQQRLKNASIQAEVASVRTLLEAQMETARLAEQRARLNGNEYEVRQAIIKQKEIEIQIAGAEVRAAELVAYAKISQAEAQAKELAAVDKLSAAKREEIEATIRAAEAEVALAKARGESVKFMEEQLQKLRSGITSVGEYERATKRAGETTKSATRDMAQGWGQVSTSVKQTTDAMAEAQKRYDKLISDAAKASAERYSRPGGGNPYSKPGEGDDADKKNPQGHGSSSGQRKSFLGGGTYANEAGMAVDRNGSVIGSVESQAQLNQRIANLYGDNFIGNQAAIAAANIQLQLDRAAQFGVANVPGNHQYYQRLRDELERLKLDMYGGGGLRGVDPVAAPRTADGAAPTRGGASPGPTYVSNITMPGGDTRTVRMSDAESQQTLQTLLRDLATAKSVAI